MIQKLIYTGEYVNVKPDVSPITKPPFFVNSIKHYFSSLAISNNETRELDEVKKRIENFTLTYG